MVANLSSHKRGWDDRWEEFSDWAEKGKAIQERLLELIDEDTRAFNRIMDAFGMPKKTREEKESRDNAIQEATREAILVPFRVMETASGAMEILRAMAETGNPNSVSDAGVGALAVRSCVKGAMLNIGINALGFEDKGFINEILARAKTMETEAENMETLILSIVDKNL
jgi:glutamate formiminotransferase/formiminotetrahydrofolate cyclodeaminase